MIPTYSNLEKAKTQLVLHHAFFATVLMSTPLVEDNTIPTAATNGVKILYNKAFFDSLTTEEVMFVLAHEVMHIVMLHPWRRDGREMGKWNMAADHAENHILLDAGFVAPKIGILADPKYAGWHAEKVYHDLPDDGQEQEQGQGQGMFRDECQDAPGDVAQQAQSEAKAQTVIAQAAKTARMAGQLSGSLAELVEEMLAPKVNWREELRRFMTSILKTDQSWQRGQRRFLAQGMYLPSLYNEGMGELVVGVDTSGSCWEDIPTFLAEVSAIAAECKPEKIHVVYCDTRINHYEAYEAGEEIRMHKCGGGGTDLRVLFDYVASQNIQPKVLVFCTDLETPFPDSEPDYPVIWAAVGNAEAPWGETVRL